MVSTASSNLGFFTLATPESKPTQIVAAAEQENDPLAISDMDYSNDANIPATLTASAAQQRPVHEYAPTIESDEVWTLAKAHWNIQNKAEVLHTLSIAVSVNEKIRQRLSNVWVGVTEDAEKFALFFTSVCEAMLGDIDLYSKRHLLVFLINCFSSLENPVIRSNAMKLTSISMWHCLVNDEARERHITINPILIKNWTREEKKFRKSGMSSLIDNGIDESSQKNLLFNRTFLSRLLIAFLEILTSITVTESPPGSIAYCERFLEFLIDLEGQLPTRRYFNALLHDHLIVPLCDASLLAKKGRKALDDAKKSKVSADLFGSGLLFVQLFSRLRFYAQFEIDVITGQSMAQDDIIRCHYSRIESLQRLAFSKFRDHMEDFGMNNAASIDSRDALLSVFQALDQKILRSFCSELDIRTESFFESGRDSLNDELLISCIIFKYAKRISQIEVVNATSLYPDETLLLNENAVPASPFSNNHCLSIPKLNLQFLTIHDYLLRNFTLFRLETAHEIRQDIEEVVRRMSPRYLSVEDKTIFSGWARMGLFLEKFKIFSVGPPKLGELKPAFVKADITFNISNCTPSLQREWDSLRPHDSLFFLSIQRNTGFDEFADVPDRELTAIQVCQKYGVRLIRGGEISALIGPNGKAVEEFHVASTANAFAMIRNQEADNSYEKHKAFGGQRTYRVLIDPNQYVQDLIMHEQDGGLDVYTSKLLNVVIRRKPQENNFKPVLETIRDLLRASEVVVPIWIRDVLLGYGDPGAAHFSRMDASTVVASADYRDTFLDWQHLKESFPHQNVVAIDEIGDVVPDGLEPPFIITMPRSLFNSLNKNDIGKVESLVSVGVRETLGWDAALKLAAYSGDAIQVQNYSSGLKGPYPEDEVKKNSVRFTPTQVQAIVAGTSPGLTMIVGPPGTGKTDVAVQIVANLYHNYPNQHTLLITHSNQALNQLFEKIVALDIDPRHLLRLGHGEEELMIEGTGGDWGKYGRVNSFLERRIKLLAQVDKMAGNLGVSGAHGNSCETAGYFYHCHVEPAVRSFHEFSTNGQSKNVEDLIEAFPFTEFFSDTPSPLFPSEATTHQIMEITRGCMLHIASIYTEIEQLRSFELLRTSKDRSNYLLVKEARIIALTCTHAALKRRELVRLGFKYDNVIMEEAAQILEVESFIPLLLQSPDCDNPEAGAVSRLKRVVLIGDHHQLPPVVQNAAFQQYGNMEQSMFSRFVRLGVPTVDLDMQGRCRPSIAELFNSSYPGLGNLNSVTEREFAGGNPGFQYDFQAIDVQNFAGKGEVEPAHHFIQNLGEAEYIVGVFMFMRLTGYPARKISILTTYNGQRELILDVIEQRCAKNPLFGRPGCVSTVDKYQGQQNDYILLSLVRTKTVGHVRDARRLVVAMSRARLGLYVFCRIGIFKECRDLRSTFDVLLSRGNGKLELVRGEGFEVEVPLDRSMTPKEKSSGKARLVIEGVEHIGEYVFELTKLKIADLKRLRDQGE